jgi:DNA-binding CsgD family transcriptional regulator
MTELESAVEELLGGLRHSRGSVLLVRGELPIDALQRLGSRHSSAAEQLRLVGAAAESGIGFAGLHQLVGARLRARAAEPAVRAVADVFSGIDRRPDDVAAAVRELLRPASRDGVVCVVHGAHLVDEPSMHVLSRLFEDARELPIGLICVVPVDGDLPKVPAARTVVLAMSPSDLRPRWLTMSSGARTALVLVAAARRVGSDGSGNAVPVATSSTEVAEIERAGMMEVLTGDGRDADDLCRAVYSLATAADRRRAHRLLAADARSDEDLRALHLTLSVTGRDEPLADRATGIGADRMTQGRPGEAAEFFERGARLTGDPASAAERMTDAADARRAAGEMDEARSLLRAARHRPLSVALHARIDLIDGAIDFSAGDLDSAYRLFIASAKAAIESDPATATGSLTRAAEVAWWSGRADRAAEVSAMLETLPSDGGDPAAFLLALFRGANRMLAGQGVEAGADLRLALTLAGTIDAPRTAILAGQAAFLLGDDRAAAVQFDRAADGFRSSGDMGELSVALQDAAGAAAWTGDLAAAWALIERSVAGTLGVSPFASAVLAHVAALRGDAAECRRLVDQSMSAAAHEHFRSASATAVWALGRLELGLGSPDRALDAMIGLTDDRSGHAHPLTALFAAPDIVEAALRSGKPDIAKRALVEFETWAAGGGHWVSAVAPRLRAMLSEQEPAGRTYESAIRAASEAGLPFEEARARLLFGEHLRRRRQRTHAREELRRAITVFDGIGAAPWALRARSELAASGETARSRGGGSQKTLTERERQIASLVSRGASNHDVASRLFLSRKTVEYHLHQVYRKLDIGSRAALAAALHDDEQDAASEASAGVERH